MNYSHALSCIRYIKSSMFGFSSNGAEYCIQYLTNLTILELNSSIDMYLIPLLAQHCNNIKQVWLHSITIPLQDLFILLRNNPGIWEIFLFSTQQLNDTSLIELIHACPHLHILCISYEPNITDIGILALSEHCTQLKELVIGKCQQITETAILQLLQRCPQLKELSVSKLSLSAETAAEIKKTRNINISRK